MALEQKQESNVIVHVEKFSAIFFNNIGRNSGWDYDPRFKTITFIDLLHRKKLLVFIDAILINNTGVGDEWKYFARFLSFQS